MPMARDNRERSLWHRLFCCRVGEVSCVSHFEGKSAALPAEFVAGSHTLEISLGITWPWLLPRLWPPAISVTVTDENGKVISTTTEPMLAMRRRYTDATVVLRFEQPLPQQLRITVCRTENGRALGHFELRIIDLPRVFHDVELLCLDTYALQHQQQIITRRFHEHVDEIQAALQLRLANPDHASLLRQTGVMLSLELEASENAPRQRWSIPAHFANGALRWELRLGPAANLFQFGPGEYRLAAKIGTHPLGELPLEVVTLEELMQVAKARVRGEAVVMTTEFRAVNHRGAEVPLQVIAEDFRLLQVTIVMECPLPDPLLPEVTLPLQIQLSKDEQIIGTEQIILRLRCGRNTFGTKWQLQPHHFAAGVGAYQLELNLAGRSLAGITFQHQTRLQLNEARAEAILQSLELSNPRLLVLRDGHRTETDHVFATDTAVIPKFTIHGQGFDADVAAIQWRVSLRLIRRESGTVTAADRMLTARAGANTHEVGRLRPQPGHLELPPGRYAYQFWKRETLLTEFQFRILAVAEIAPYTETLVRDSLKIENARLLAVAYGSRYESADIPDSTEFIVPEFTLHSSGYNRYLPRWQTELRLTLETPAGVRQDWGQLPVLLQPEPLTVNNIHIRLAGTALSQQSGRHRLLIHVAGRELACLPFQVLTAVEVLARIEVTDLTVVAIAKSNQQTTNPATILLGETSSLGITGALTVGLLAPGQATEVTFEIYLDDVCLAQKSAAISLAQRLHTFKLRPILLTRLLSNGNTGTRQLKIVVRVAGRIGQLQAITLNCHERITNFEGQLNIDSTHLDVSDAEYQAILNKL